MHATEPDQLYGYDVIDPSGNKIGSVDGVWVDDATNQLEFIGVKTGWIFGHTHLIPAENAQTDDANRTVQAPFSTDQIKGAPSFATDAELSPQDEQTIYDYYGIQRSTAPSPTGLTGGGGTTAAADTSSVDTADSGRVTLSEEELEVGKRPVEAGQVRLRKVVNTEHQEVPVELRREEVTIERVPASGVDAAPASAFQEQEINVPVTREEPVVGKEAYVTGAVEVNKNVQTETQTVGGDVRREDVEVDRDVETPITATRDTSTPDTGS